MDKAAPPSTDQAGDEQEPLSFGSGAKFANRKIARSSSCWLQLADGQLTLKSESGVELDVPVTDLTNLEAPLATLGCGLSFEADGKHWYITFNEEVEVDVGALRALGLRFGLFTAEAQDLESQFVVCGIWLELLELAIAEASWSDMTPAEDEPSA
jgi:hypothetical protein